MRTRKQELVSDDLKPFVCGIIKEYREKYNYSLEDLARALNYKKNRQTLHKYETGTLNIPYEIFFDIAEIFNISSDVIKDITMTREEEEFFEKKLIKNIVNTFEEKGVKVTDKSKIVKKSVFTIYENESTVYAGKVEYKYYLDITYTYNNKNIEYKNIVLGIGTVDKAGIAAPNLNIIYTPVLGMYGNENVAKDEITVKYRPGSEKADWEKPVSVYLVEQTANYGSTEDTKVSLNKDNIKIECYNKTSESDKLGFYTNVAGWTGENSSLTEGGSSIYKLYNVSVYIWKDKTDGMTIKAVITLDIADDYFTKVDSVNVG